MPEKVGSDPHMIMPSPCAVVENVPIEVQIIDAISDELPLLIKLDMRAALRQVFMWDLGLKSVSETFVL